MTGSQFVELGYLLRRNKESRRLRDEALDRRLKIKRLHSTEYSVLYLVRSKRTKYSTASTKHSNLP